MDTAPRRLICRLAIDDIAVAKPVLTHSKVLTDDDLVQIAKSRGQLHLHAISMRQRLTAPVTDVIVQHGEAPVLIEVAKNNDAKFSGTGLQTLAEKARSDGELLTALGARRDLPPDFMAEIKQRVMEKIKAEMAGEYTESDIVDLGTLVEKCAENLDIDSIKHTNDDLQEQVQKDAFSERDLVALATAKRMTETVHALSLLTGLDDRMVSHCMFKADIAALGIICKANGFQSSTYLTLVQTRMGPSGLTARDVARAMREYDTLSVQNAMRTLRFLKVRKNTEPPSG